MADKRRRPTPTRRRMSNPGLWKRRVATSPAMASLSRLCTGTGAFGVIGRKRWFAVCGLMVAAAIASMVLKGFTFGIDFQGGTRCRSPAPAKNGGAGVRRSSRPSTRPSARTPKPWSSSRKRQLRRPCKSGSETLDNEETEKLRTALFEKFKPKGGHRRSAEQTGHQRLRRLGDVGAGDHQEALIALVGVLVLVGIYITIRYMKIHVDSRAAALGFDLTVTAGFIRSSASKSVPRPSSAC